MKIAELLTEDTSEPWVSYPRAHSFPWCFWYDPRTGETVADQTAHCNAVAAHWEKFGLDQQPSGLAFLETDAMARGWVRVRTDSRNIYLQCGSPEAARKALGYIMETPLYAEQRVIIEIETFKEERMPWWDRSHFTEDLDARVHVSLQGFAEAEAFVKGRRPRNTNQASARNSNSVGVPSK